MANQMQGPGGEVPADNPESQMKKNPTGNQAPGMGQQPPTLEQPGGPTKVPGSPNKSRFSRA